MNYLVQLNNGFESDETPLVIFETLEEAKEYVKKECEVYYNIIEGEFEYEDESVTGSGKTILTNCNDRSITWFYSSLGEFKAVEEL